MTMRIVTKFTSVGQFVQSFGRFCSERACFIPSAQSEYAGVETAFSLHLADGTPMLRGVCVVRESWTTSENAYGRPGVLLGIVTLTPESEGLFVELCAKATVQMEPMFVEEDSGGIPEPIDAVDSVPDATVRMSRPPVMTLLGIAPLDAKRAPRMAMPALSTEIRTAPRRRPHRSMWDRLIGRVRAVFRTLRWAYRRQRGVRASVRRLPTRI